MANHRKQPQDKAVRVNWTVPTWISNEVDRRAGTGNSSAIATQLLKSALSMGGDETALEYRLKELEETITKAEEERERLEDIKAQMNAEIKRLDDPAVIGAIKTIAERATNYQRSENEPMTDRAIRTMAERILKGPVPNGFIDRVRSEVA